MLISILEITAFPDKLLGQTIKQPLSNSEPKKP